MDQFEKQPVPSSLLDSTTKAKITPFANLVATPEQTPHNSFFAQNKYYVWIIIVGLVIIATLAWWLLRKPGAAPVKDANVSLSIEAPEEVTSGGDVVYKVKIENKDAAKLVGLELELIYPEGLTYVSSQPNSSSLSGSTFPVPDLPSAKSTCGFSSCPTLVTLFIKVKANGDIGDTRTLNAKLHYHFENFSSSFIKEASQTIRLIAADVTLDIAGPKETNNAQLVQYEFRYKNSSDHPIDNARLQVTYPQGFNFATSDPVPSLARNIWNLGRLNSGEEGKITVQGNFAAAIPGESRTFQEDFLVLDNKNNYYNQATAKYTTAINALPLLVTQELDGADGETIVHPGDQLTYRLKYQNNGSVAAQGVNIIATIDSKAVDFQSIRAEGANVSNNTITWNASSESALETLKPGDSGELRFSIKVKNPPVKDSSKNLEINTKIKVKSNEYDTFLPGNSLTLKIQTQALLIAGLEYVSGQLPPRVGNSTQYRLTLTVRNTTNDLSDALVTAFVPLNPGNVDAKSLGGTDASLASFDPATTKLTWKLGTVTAGTGSVSPSRSINFLVRVNPSQSQVGDVVSLLKNLKLSGKDVFTQKDVILEVSDKTTDDINNGSAGQGIVTE